MSIKIWIYSSNRQAFTELDRTDSRFTWDWPHTPDGMVRFRPRRDGKVTEYVYYGETKEEAAGRANQYRLEEIAKLEAKIVTLREALVKP